MEIIEICKEDREYKWKKIPVHCYSLIYDTCTKFPSCQSYCFHYSEKPMKEVAIAYYRGTSHIREIKKENKNGN